MEEFLLYNKFERELLFRTKIMEAEKYQKAWKKFQEKIKELKKRQFEIISNINKKLDQQKVDLLMNKIKKK